MNKKFKDKNFIISSKEKISEALKKINKNEHGILFATNKKNQLVGVLTDGDIRRAFLDGETIDSKIEILMNKDFVYAEENTSFESIMKKFDKRYRFIPIVNQNNELVDFYSLFSDARIPIYKPSLGGNEAKYAMDCLSTNWISSKGKYVIKFEEEFAAYCGAKYGVSTSNGTVGLHLALKSIGIGKEDEVIVPSLTFIASANSISYCGATPVFADVDMDTRTIMHTNLDKLLTEKTKAIMPVHLYGQPAKMDEIISFARLNNLKIIEDSAEAHGAKYKGKYVGTLSDVGVFSFYGNKIMTTGEGGMVVTDNKETYEKLLLLRDHGMDINKRYWHNVIGYNYRMTNIQAAIGCAQLENIEKILSRKKKISERYDKVLSKFKYFKLPPRNDWSHNVDWLYAIELNLHNSRENFRDSLIVALNKKNIECSPFFYPMYKMPPYEKKIHNKVDLNWKITMVDTGINTMTGGRVLRLKKYLTKKNTQFCLTYGDGLSDINLSKLFIFHKKHKKIATLTTVRPPARFGYLKLKKDQVLKFGEKKNVDAGWINGGFFIFNEKIFNYIDNDTTFLEREPLENLATNKQLRAFKHYGFWQCMDTLRDKLYLDEYFKKNK